MQKIMQAIAVWLLESLGKVLWGFKPNLMAEFVHQHGALKALSWFVKHMPKYERILKQWGPIRTHLVSTVISTINGCPYCTHGHAYAFQLHYLKNTKELFPIDEQEFIELHKLGGDKIVQHLEPVLNEAGLADELSFLQRMLELCNDPTLVSSIDDTRLLHLITMFSALNACGIKGKTEIDQAHDPINRDHAMRDHYVQLREGLR